MGLHDIVHGTDLGPVQYLIFLSPEEELLSWSYQDSYGNIRCQMKQLKVLYKTRKALVHLVLVMDGSVITSQAQNLGLRAANRVIFWSTRLDVDGLDLILGPSDDLYNDGRTILSPAAPTLDPPTFEFPAHVCTSSMQPGLAPPPVGSHSMPMTPSIHPESTLPPVGSHSMPSGLCTEAVS